MTTPLLTTRASLNGIDFNSVEPAGVEWWLYTIDGWGSPKSTIDVQQRARSDGGWAGDAFLTPRTVSLAGVVLAPTADQLTDALDRLYAAVALNTVTLTVWQHGFQRFAKVRRADEVLVTQYGDTRAEWSVQVVALDPRKTSTALSGSTGLPSNSGGLTVPFTVPFAINSTVVTGQVNLVNPGNTTGSVVLQINGPVTGPVITHVSTGTQLVFSSSLTLQTGEYMVVDMDARTVLAQGTASRSGYVTGRGWSGFDPGPNTWAFTAQSGTGTLTVTATPSWL